jgi:hypothetical protein
MEPLPLPSHIHYELLLQLLERQTMLSTSSRPAVQEQVHQLIITLRKALAQQKHLEESCQRYNVPIDYRWSLNNLGLGQTEVKVEVEKVISLPQDSPS